jgi:hypothetical protein
MPVLSKVNVLKRSSNQVSLEPYGFARIRASAPAKSSAGILGVSAPTAATEDDQNQGESSNSAGGFATAAIVIVVLMILATVAAYGSNPSNLSNQVRLTKPVGDIVQMFANPGSGADAFAVFPVGTACTKLDGPGTPRVRANFGDGITSDYYKLTCNGITGYVNVKFVR